VRSSTFLRQVAAILVRLPMGFAIPFILFFVLWTLFLFKELNQHLDIRSFNPFRAIPILSRIDDVLIGIVLVLTYIIGLLVAYNRKPTPSTAIRRPLADLVASNSTAVIRQSGSAAYLRCERARRPAMLVDRRH
jgi:hypothetical protein